MKSITSLTISDLMANPVWEYLNSASVDDMTVRAVEHLPVEHLQGRVVGTRVLLSNGQRVWGLIGNVDTKNFLATEHFLTLSAEKSGHWFTLSRYHDSDYSKHGPKAFARFLALPLDEIFPITYDIKEYVEEGESRCLAGKILKEPKEKLSQAELIALAVS